jgi:hypothetical protein
MSLISSRRRGRERDDSEQTDNTKKRRTKRTIINDNLFGEDQPNNINNSFHTTTRTVSTTGLDSLCWNLSELTVKQGRDAFNRVSKLHGPASSHN